jgi:hypothetical protein
MLIRYLVTLLGAAIVTAGLLLFMNHAANTLSLKDPIKYFRIFDFIPAKNQGRRLPKPPPKVGLPPATPRLDYGIGDDAAPRIQAPSVQPEAVPAPLQPSGNIGPSEWKPTERLAPDDP